MVIVVDNGTGTTNYGRSVVSGATDNTYSKSGATSVTGIEANKSQTAVGNLTNANSTKTYVPSTGKFNAHLIKISDTVVGIYFQKI